MRNLQEQVKKAFCYQTLFWPFTVWINCSSDLKNFANSRPSASNFKSFSWSLEQFFLTVGQNNFGNKIPFLFSFLKAKVLFCKEKPDRCMKFTGLFLVKLTFRLRDLQSFSKQWLLFSSHLSQEHQLHNKVNKVVKFSILEKSLIIFFFWSLAITASTSGFEKLSTALKSYWF